MRRAILSGDSNGSMLKASRELKMGIRGTFMKRACVYGTLMLFAIAVFAGTSQAQMQMGNDVLLFSSVYRGVATPARYFYLDQAIIDYGPGTFSAAGSEESVRFFTVTGGEVKFTVGSMTDTYETGKSFSVPAGTIVKGYNESRTVKARVFVCSIVPPRGAGAVTVPGTSDSSPSPVRLYSSRLPVGPLPPIIDVVSAGHKYEPGFVTPPHVMNQVNEILHLEGATTYEYLDGAVETYGVGQASPMYMGRPGTMGNRSAAPSVWIVTNLVIPGTPLVSPLR